MDGRESSTPTRIKLSHQGEIKLVSDWGTTLFQEEQMKVINLAKKQTKSAVLTVKISRLSKHYLMLQFHGEKENKENHIIQMNADKK